MAKMNMTVITGKCMEMCPEKERIMREREGLLHKFEWADDTDEFLMERSRARSNRFNRARKVNRKADVSRTVKVFARSAAGLDKTSPNDLRPVQILEKTVEYLIGEILPRRDVPYTTAYDFVFDRLRGVRQDLVIQRINDDRAIRILESIVRFHVYSAYWCRNEPLASFDPHINRKHLRDNLNRLLRLYEYNNYWEKSRNEFESIYLILYPGSMEVINRALKLRRLEEFINDNHFQHVLDLYLSYELKNFASYFRILKSLPQFFIVASFEHAKHMRQYALVRLAKGFGSSTCQFPLESLERLLLYPSMQHVEEDLYHLSVKMVSNKSGKYAVFSKSDTLHTSQLEKIRYDLAPLAGGKQGLSHPEQLNEIPMLIYPQLSNHKPKVQGIKDWFSDGEE